jgi:preprotein translocase subunit SecD
VLLPRRGWRLPAVNTILSFAESMAENVRLPTAPVIQGKITDRGQITGSFTREGAEDLAIVLRSGQLPGHARIVSEASVASDHWRLEWGALAGLSALVVLAAGAGALFFAWYAFRR